MHEWYSIIPAECNEFLFLEYVKEKSFKGVVHPNLPNGMLFKLSLDGETANLLKLKFNFIVFNRSVKEP